MPDGSRESYDALGPILEDISAHVGDEPCCTYIGTDGAGHFVKMIHDGIEYADMQFIGKRTSCSSQLVWTTVRWLTSSRRGTAATSTPTSSRSPQRCCARSMPRPAARSLMSSSTPPA
jgi:hypothetical protein